MHQSKPLNLLNAHLSLLKALQLLFFNEGIISINYPILILKTGRHISFSGFDWLPRKFEKKSDKNNPFLNFL